MGVTRHKGLAGEINESMINPQVTKRIFLDSFILFLTFNNNWILEAGTIED